MRQSGGVDLAPADDEDVLDGGGELRDGIIDGRREDDTVGVRGGRSGCVLLVAVGAREDDVDAVREGAELFSCQGEGDVRHTHHNDFMRANTTSLLTLAGIDSHVFRPMITAFPPEPTVVSLKNFMSPERRQGRVPLSESRCAGRGGEERLRWRKVVRYLMRRNGARVPCVYIYSMCSNPQSGSSCRLLSPFLFFMPASAAS